MASLKMGIDGGSGTCQDCGNKAKRGCEHKRCRTCCKAGGFQCPTHVRSTWIPVSRRRQMLHHRLSLSAAALPLRLITSPSSSSSGFQGRIQSFPAEVNSLANFRRVRVVSDDNAVDQAAYQASVNIGGHVFSGILYDQGPISASPGGVGGGGGGGGGVGGLSGGENLSYLQMHPFYASNAPFMLPAGMQFFPHPKP